MTPIDPPVVLDPTMLASTTVAMYPLRFEPIFQYRLWGGRRLTEVLDAPPGEPRMRGSARDASRSGDFER